MTKPKFDLSNPGGKPKGPYDEMTDDSGWLKDLWMSSGIIGPIALVLIGLGLLVLALFKFVG